MTAFQRRKIAIISRRLTTECQTKTRKLIRIVSTALSSKNPTILSPFSCRLFLARAVNTQIKSMSPSKIIRCRIQTDQCTGACNKKLPTAGMSRQNPARKINQLFRAANSYLKRGDNMGIFISASSDGTNGRGRNISSSERFCRSCNNNGDKCGRQIVEWLLFQHKNMNFSLDQFFMYLMKSPSPLNM